MSAIAAQCRNGHEVAQIAVFCPAPDCDEFVILGGGQHTRTRLGIPLVLLILAGLAAIVLFRSADTIWAAYALAGLSLVHLYAVVFSRGAALLPVSVVTALLVGVWALGMRWDKLETLTTASGKWIPAVLWLLGLGYAVLLGWTTAISPVRARATYVLGAMAFVVGLWLVVAIQFDNQLGYPALLDFLILACAIVPLFFTLAAFGFHGVRSIAAYFVIISAYLAVLQPLVEALTQTLTVFLPNALDITQPVRRPDPAWLTILRWKSAISTFAGIIAAILVVSTSVADVARTFTSGDYSFLTTSIKASGHRSAQALDPFSRMAEQLTRMALRTARTIYLMANFMMLTVAKVAQTLYELVRRLITAMWTAVRYVAAPVLCFSALSVLLVVVLHELSTYVHGFEPAFHTWALWGGIACAVGLALLLTGASLGLTPLAKDAQPVSFNGTGPAGLALGGFWILFSVVSVLLWPLNSALDNIGISASAMRFGPLLRTNALMVAGFVVVLMLLVLPSAARRRAQGTSNRLTTIMLLLAVSAFAVAAVYLGSGPTAHWLFQLTS